LGIHRHRSYNGPFANVYRRPKQRQRQSLSSINTVFPLNFNRVLTYRNHSQPTVVKNVTATLEKGTGVNDSYITANIHVQSGGLFWNGGSLDIGSSNQDFIYGFSPNTPSGGVASGNLVQHVVVGSFQLDLGPAIGAGGMPVIVSPETGWGWQTIVLAHAVMMGLAWVGLLPAGAIIIRFLGSKVKDPTRIHQILQLSSIGIVFIAFFVGVGSAPLVYYSNNRCINRSTIPIRTPMAWSHRIPRLIPPSRTRLVPPQTLHTRQPHLPSLVHPSPPLARSSPHLLRPHQHRSWNPTLRRRRSPASNLVHSRHRRRWNLRFLLLAHSPSKTKTCQRFIRPVTV